MPQVVIALAIVAELQTGVAAQYSPGIMEQVAYNRGLTPGYCDIAATYAPMYSYVRLGSLVTNEWLDDDKWIENDDNNNDNDDNKKYYGDCRVIDEPAPQDRARIIERGIIVEIPRQHAWRMCGQWADWKPEYCPVIVVPKGGR